MSLTFSQIVSLIDRNCKSNDISYPIAEKTADINLALDCAIDIMLKNSGTWQFDDNNHGDYPIITTNLVAGQRDYSFLTDGSGNLILDIYKVMVADEQGTFHEITPRDVQSEINTESFYDGTNAQGVPDQYDKTANGIFLDAIPRYNSTGGLKIYINREGSYFTTADTTKKPGIPGLYHEYLALRPSYQYAYRNSLANIQALQIEMLGMEKKMKDNAGQRERDKDKVFAQRITPFI